MEIFEITLICAERGNSGEKKNNRTIRWNILKNGLSTINKNISATIQSDIITFISINKI